MGKFRKKPLDKGARLWHSNGGWAVWKRMGFSREEVRPMG